jgi:predicted AAA+ superfamily ATPase
MFKRRFYSVLCNRVKEPRRFVQVLRGPRQTGKTTLARQVMEGVGIPSHYATGDEAGLKDRDWLAQQWERARLLAPPETPALLVLDEVQKIPGWSETVKRMWDEDSLASRQLRVLLLGSSALLVQRGLSESLAGRYEVTHISHWSFSEMQECFGFDAQQYIYFGGYPGAAPLVDDYDRWSCYVLESLIEPTISRDILMMTQVDKPALLRQLFDLGCAYSGRILSYQKMLGQLHDAGNTTTLAHYLRLLESAGLLAGLKKHAGDTARRRASSPKLLVLNTALMSTASRRRYEDAVRQREFWGHLAETAVGAALVNGLQGTGADICYWAGRNREVDFVISRGDTLVAIEVKSGRRRMALPGVAEFSRQFDVRKTLLVGGDGIPLDEFFATPPESWLKI